MVFTESQMNKFLQGVQFDLVEALASKLTREHGRDTGDLAGSILKNIGKPVTDNTIVIDMAEQGRYLEYGTPPHMPPVEELEGWAMRKLGDKKLAWALAYSIKKRGTKPFPFIRPTLRFELKDIIKKNLKIAFK